MHYIYSTRIDFVSVGDSSSALDSVSTLVESFILRGRYSAMHVTDIPIDSQVTLNFAGPQRPSQLSSGWSADGDVIVGGDEAERRCGAHQHHPAVP